MKDKLNLSVKIIIVFLRIFIGGHLFFNGLIKIINPDWTAKPFLDGSYGLFRWLSSQDSLIGIVDKLNEWVLLLAGIALIIGIFERIAALSGILLIALYYLAYIPLDILSSNTGGSGPAFIVNPLLIEATALLLILAVPTGKIIGIERLFQHLTSKRKQKQQQEKNEPLAGQLARREVLKSLAAVPFLGIFSIPFFQSRTYEKVDALSGATSVGMEEGFGAEYRRLKELNLDDNARVKESRDAMQHGQIGKLTVSRLVAENNIISGNYFPRDIEYVADLAKIYNTEDRIFMTLKSMEKSGINTIFLNFKNFLDFQLLNYWKEWGGRMQWFSELLTSDITKFEPMLERNLKIGASGILISREACDKWVANKEFDNIPKALEILKKYNVPGGIGAYYNETIAFAVKQKIKPDFFYKSFHKDTYWSAHPRSNREYLEIYKEVSNDHDKFHYNLWCREPEEFAELMKGVDVPWIAFKTTADGAIPFQEGFEFALRNGANFVSCNLFDFQIPDCIRSLDRAYLNL